MKKTPLQILGELRDGVVWACKYGSSNDIESTSKHFRLYSDFCREIGINQIVLTTYKNFNRIINFHNN